MRKRTYKNLSEKAKEIYDYYSSNFSDKDIKEFLKDGEALDKEGVKDQATIEELWIAL